VELDGADPGRVESDVESDGDTSGPPAHLILEATDAGAFASLRRSSTPRAERYALGRRLRQQAPRSALGRWKPADGRTDPVDLVIARSPSVGSLKVQSDDSSQAKKTRLPETTVGRGRPADATQAIEVPAVTGLLLSEARDRLARRGFTIGRIERQTTSTWAPDTVLTQEPVPGSRVVGTSISLVVAEQPESAVPAP